MLELKNKDLLQENRKANGKFAVNTFCGYYIKNEHIWKNGLFWKEAIFNQKFAFKLLFSAGNHWNLVSMPSDCSSWHLIHWLPIQIAE